MNILLGKGCDLANGAVGWSVYTMMNEVCPQIPVKAEKCHLLMKPQVVSLILSGINTVEKRRAMNRIEKI